MALIPLKARAGIAALTSAAAVARLVLLTSAIVTISAVAGQSSGRADTIEVRNLGANPHVLSDMEVIGKVGGNTVHDIILKAGDKSDDIVMKPGDSRVFQTPTAFDKITKIEFSEQDAKEHKTTVFSLGPLGNNPICG